jgi:hypothetical protein
MQRFKFHPKKKGEKNMGGKKYKYNFKLVIFILTKKKLKFSNSLYFLTFKLEIYSFLYFKGGKNLYFTSLKKNKFLKYFYLIFLKEF